MKSACAAALLLASTTAAAQDSDRDAGRWVCVPSKESGWRCGRGANAPDPAPLPPEKPPASPPTGYTPPDRDTGVPAYLLDPTLPGPGEEATADAGDDARPGGPPAQASDPAQTVSPEADDAEPAASAGMPDPAQDDSARTADADGGADEARSESRDDTGAEAASAQPVGPEDARYSIQLTAARDRDSLAAYRDRLADAGVDVFYRAWEDAGGTWHVLLTGRFASVAAARRALAALPEGVRDSGAWIRPLASLEP